jgi:hypothetical protein
MPGNCPAALTFVAFNIWVAANYDARVAAVRPSIRIRWINQRPNRQAHSLTNDDGLSGTEYRKHIK